jgi:hypothetical protein
MAKLTATFKGNLRFNNVVVNPEIEYKVEAKSYKELMEISSNFNK